MQQDPGGAMPRLIGRAPETIIADLVESLGQHVQTESADELDAGDALGVPRACVIVLVAEGDMGLVHGQEAASGDRYAEDVTGQIAQDGISPVAEVLAERAPRLLPDLGRDLGEEIGTLCLECLSKPLTDHGREFFHRHEKPVRRGMPGSTVLAKPASRDQEMDVRVIEHLSGPRMKHGQDSRDGADVAVVPGEFAQGRSDGFHKNIVEQLLFAKEEGSQFGRGGGDYMKVIAGKDLGRALGHPPDDLAAVASGAGTVTAAVKTPEGLVAVAAPVASAAHGRGHAAEDVIECPVVGREHEVTESLQVGFDERADHIGDLEEVIGHG